MLHWQFLFTFIFSVEVVYVTIWNPAFCLALCLTGVHFRVELQHVGHVGEQKIKRWPIRTREIAGARLLEELYAYLSSLEHVTLRVSGGEFRVKNATLCLHILFWNCFVLHQKICVFFIFISFFDEVPNICNRMLTSQKSELVIRNCQWNCLFFSTYFKHFYLISCFHDKRSHFYSLYDIMSHNEKYAKLEINFLKWKNWIKLFSKKGS